MLRKNIAWQDDKDQRSAGGKSVTPSPPLQGSSSWEILHKRNLRHSAVWRYFCEFTGNTSLHGLKYLGEKGRPILERIWWSIMFILSFIVCAYMIRKVWIKWDQSPVIVSFAESSWPVFQVPFPAITICSETKARQTVYNFTEMFHKRLQDNLTAEERADYEAISLVCDNHLLTEGNLTSDHSTVDILNRVAPQFEEMMWHCKWKTTPGNCSWHFSPILTEEGLCFSFNMLDAEELFRKENLQTQYHYLNHGKKSEGWTLDEGYPKDGKLDTYPIRGTGFGAKAGLTVLLKAHDYDLDYLCRGPVQGFKILLHNPAEVPRMSQQYFRAPLNQEVVVAVKPNMMTTSEGLRNYDPHRRQCYFPKERYLHFFKIYTQQNCELECLTNYTMAICGCVSFSMPRNDSMPICSSGSTICVGKAQDELLVREVQSELHHSAGESAEASETRSKREADLAAAHCDCLPSCTALDYNAETSQADFNWRRLFWAYKANFSEVPGAELARVMIFFKEPQFIPSRRSELYGQTDFLANCGGLLGLFMGFSILSLIEILYFLTIRILCNIRKRVSKKETFNVMDQPISPKFQQVDESTK